MKEKKTTAQLAKENSMELDKVERKLYAFELFGLITPEAARELSLDELVGATLLQTLNPTEAPRSVAQADEATRALANEIASDYMRLLSLNHFELLGASETASAVEIRDRFIEFASRYNPGRFKGAELGEFKSQGEEIFLRGVKAYGTLSDVNSKVKYLDKLKAERSKTAEPKKKAGEAFKIQTKLLDAEPQFQKGLKYLKEQKYAQAVEFFQYAVDIDSRKASYTAHLAWATYNVSPLRNKREAEEALRRAQAIAPEDEMAAFFLGKLLLTTDRREEGLPHLKRVAELAPRNAELVREVKALEKPKK